MTADRVLLERIVRNGFVDRPATSVGQAVRLTTALQAQDPVAGRLGVRVRSGGLTDADVRRALDVDRTVVKSSLLRGTIHLVAAEDLRWITALVAPQLTRDLRTRWAGLGLSAEVLTRSAEALQRILAGAPRTRADVAASLADAGIIPDHTDPAVTTHLLFHASTLGLVCRGPDVGRDATFVLVDDWVPDAAVGPSGDGALAELARRYFAAYSPATAADFTTWSGLPAGRAIGLIRDELTPCEVFGRPGFRLGEVEPALGVALLPAFDNYLLGYRDRPFISSERRGEVYVGGVIRPVLLVDGRVTGRWQLTRRGDDGIIRLRVFEALSRRVRGAIEAEIADLAGFIGINLDMQADTCL
jgi:hypothetical protein